MINMLRVAFVPSEAEWIHSAAAARPLVAVAEKDGPLIHIFAGDGDSTELQTVAIHAASVVAIAYNPVLDVRCSGSMVLGSHGTSHGCRMCSFAA